MNLIMRRYVWGTRGTKTIMEMLASDGVKKQLIIRGHVLPKSVS